MSGNDNEHMRSNLRDIALGGLPDEQRHALLKWGSDNGVDADDPLWSMILASVHLTGLMRASEATSKSAIEHLKTRYKLIVEQLEGAATAASKAARAELERSASRLQRALIDAQNGASQEFAEVLKVSAMREIERAAGGGWYKRWGLPVTVGILVAVLSVVGILVSAQVSGYLEPPRTVQSKRAEKLGWATNDVWKRLPNEIKITIKEALQ